MGAIVDQHGFQRGGVAKETIDVARVLLRQCGNTESGVLKGQSVLGIALYGSANDDLLADPHGRLLSQLRAKRAIPPDSVQAHHAQERRRTLFSK